VPAIIIGDDYRPDTARLEWSTSGDSGEVEVYVVVDPENEFEETNENNNTASKVMSYGGVAEKTFGHPAAFGFSNCTPNPVTGFAQIAYAVPEPMPVRLRIYDPTGRSVADLVASPHQPGTYQLVWDGKDDSGKPVGAGVYLMCLDNGKQTHTRSLVVVR
jgi:hypothetical protein